MSPCRPILLLPIALLTVAHLSGAASDIAPLTKRTESVVIAEQFLAPRELGSLPAGPALKDPFNPPDFIKTIIKTTVPTTTEPAVGVITVPDLPPPPKVAPERELIEAIAPLIAPDGRATLSGVTYLLFGKKRLKVGDTLPILYKDKPYELTITAIGDTTFTLRLNGEETIRPIRSSKLP
jgi:hypothetical protein